MANPRIQQTQQEQAAFPETEQAPFATPLVVEQEKFDPKMQNYLMALADRDPYTRDYKTTRDLAKSAVKNDLPKLPGMEDQAEEFCAFVDKGVRALPQSAAMPEILLRVSVTPVQLMPVALPEPNEAAFVMAFDAIEGVMRSCDVPASEEPANLSGLQIAAGAMVIGQAAPKAVSQINNSQPFTSGSGENLYALRERDRLLKGDSPIEEPAIQGALTDVLSYKRPPETEEERQKLKQQEDARLAVLISRGLVGGGLEQNPNAQVASPAPRPNWEKVAGAAAAEEELEERAAGLEAHERRFGNHERRMPGRPEYFDAGSTETEGLTAVERIEIARREGRLPEQETERAQAEAAKAESEAQKLQAETIAAQQEEAQRMEAPERPEAPVANETIALTPDGTETTVVHAPAVQEQAEAGALGSAAEAFSAPPQYIATIDARTGRIVTGVAISGRGITREELRAGVIPAEVQEVDLTSEAEKRREANQEVVVPIDANTGIVLAGEEPVGGEGVTLNQIIEGSLPSGVHTANEAQIQTPGENNQAEIVGGVQNTQEFETQNRDAQDTETQRREDLRLDTERERYYAGLNQTRDDRRQESLTRAAEERRSEESDRRETLSRREDERTLRETTERRENRRLDDERRARDLDRDRDQQAERDRDQRRLLEQRSSGYPVGYPASREYERSLYNQGYSREEAERMTRRRDEDRRVAEAENQDKGSHEFVKEFIAEATEETKPGARAGDAVMRAVVHNALGSSPSTTANTAGIPASSGLGSAIVGALLAHGAKKNAAETKQEVAQNTAENKVEEKAEEVTEGAQAKKKKGEEETRKASAPKFTGMG